MARAGAGLSIAGRARGLEFNYICRYMHERYSLLLPPSSFTWIELRPPFSFFFRSSKNLLPPVLLYKICLIGQVFNTGTEIFSGEPPGIFSEGRTPPLARNVGLTRLKALLGPGAAFLPSAVILRGGLESAHRGEER